MSLDQRLEYIQQSASYLLWEVYSWVRSWCKKAEPQYPVEPDPVIEEDPDAAFEQACIDGDLPKVKTLYKQHDDFDANKGLLLASEHGHRALAEWLIDNKYANQLNKALELSCKNNKYATAELMVEKGADTLVGVRHSTSLNITRMLYRYRQNAEMIHS